MDSLVNYHIAVDYLTKEVTFRRSDDLYIVFCGERQILPLCVISTTTSRKLLKKHLRCLFGSCYSYLSCLGKVRIYTCGE